jgi:hypothetical protein
LNALHEVNSPEKVKVAVSPQTSRTTYAICLARISARRTVMYFLIPPMGLGLGLSGRGTNFDAPDQIGH